MSRCELLDDYLANQLEDSATALFAQHLEFCQTCRAAVEQTVAIEKQLSDLVRGVSPDVGWLGGMEGKLRDALEMSPSQSPRTPVAPAKSADSLTAVGFGVLFALSVVVLTSLVWLGSNRSPVAGSRARDLVPPSDAADTTDGANDALATSSLANVQTVTVSDIPSERVVAADGFLLAKVNGNTSAATNSNEPSNTGIDIYFVLPTIRP